MFNSKQLERRKNGTGKNDGKDDDDDYDDDAGSIYKYTMKKEEDIL